MLKVRVGCIEFYGTKSLRKHTAPKEEETKIKPAKLTKSENETISLKYKVNKKKE